MACKFINTPVKQYLCLICSKLCKDTHTKLKIKISKQKNKMIRFLHFNHFLLMLFLIGVGCHDFQWEPNYFDFKQIKKDIFTQNDVSISSLISESMSLNWTENQDCLNELIAIKNGLANFDEWAVKSKINMHNLI